MRTLGGRYRLDDQIGAGGMSRVFRGHDEVLDREVAVKLLTAEHVRDTPTHERARNEARYAARLAHPNVAAVYDFGTSRRAGQGAAFLVMELVDGPLLSDVLASGPLDWQVAARVCAEVSAGLAAAHSQGIVHRDIKPANVVLTPSGAKILDFGIAATAGQTDAVPGYPSSPAAGATVLGTAAYIAPERLDGRPVTPATDMYALGVLLYQSLTGVLPWSARTDEQLLRSHRLVPPAALPPIDGLADEVAQVCAQCLDKRPGARPTAVAAALLLATTVDATVYLPPVVAHVEHTVDFQERLHAPTTAY
jgi:eukaryotic-like serine/threonine-protein kinase